METNILQPQIDNATKLRMLLRARILSAAAALTDGDIQTVVDELAQGLADAQELRAITAGSDQGDNPPPLANFSGWC